MKILQIISSLDTGGIRTVLTGLCNELCNDNDIYIGVYKGPKQNVSNLFDSKIKVIYFKNLKEYVSILKQYHFDVVHFHLTLKSGIFALVTKLYSKSVTACHSHISEDSKHGFFYSHVYKNISLFLIKHYIDLKIACSDLAGYYLYGSDFLLVPNAINCKINSFNNEQRKSIRNDFKLNNFVFGYVGHIHERKNLEFICEVLNELNQSVPVTFMIVGDATENKDLRKKIEQYNFVKVTGMVNNPSVYYSAFDAFVLPSLFEGLPMVALEAQANGLHVYLSNTISKLTNVAERCTFLPLNDHNAWLMELKKATKENRNIDNVCLNTMYDTAIYSKKIQDAYLQKVNAQ